MTRVLSLSLGLHVCLLWHSPAFAADEAIRGRIPEEGTWVKYELSGSDGLSPHFEWGDAEGEFTLKVLQHEMRDGQPCRWFEVEWFTTSPEKNVLSSHVPDSGAVKVLVGEAGLLNAGTDVTVVALISQVNDEEPYVHDLQRWKVTQPDALPALKVLLQSIAMSNDLLIDGDLDPDRLAIQVMQLSSFRAKFPEDEALPRPPFGPQLTITARQEKAVQTPIGMKDGHLVQAACWVVVVDFELTTAIPFGLSSITVRVDPGNVDGSATLKATHYGDNAVTALPDVP